MIIIYLLHTGACTCHRFSYNGVVSYSDGQLGPDASSFNLSRLERILATLAAEPAWREAQTDLVASCRDPFYPFLPARQQAIYSYSCIRWSLLTECDSMQYTNGSLDVEGMYRRYMFLTGKYPTSPKSLFEGVLRRPSIWCFYDTYPLFDKPYQAKDVEGINYRIAQVYIAALDATKCLMQNYINKQDGTVNFIRLEKALSSKNPNNTGVKLLKELVARCADYHLSYLTATVSYRFYDRMTADKFINCWATQGVRDIANQEAKNAAREFPEGCSFRLDNSKEQGHSYQARISSMI